MFAGREAARALAKMSLREEDCTDEGLEELSKREQETLRDWEERLLDKYSVVGQARTFARLRRLLSSCIVHWLPGDTRELHGPCRRCCDDVIRPATR